MGPAFASFLARFDKVKPTGGQYLVRCPAHEDKSPSLAVKEGDEGQVLIKCHGGCSSDAILGAMGLKPADLFEPKAEAEAKRVIQAEYSYKDEQGVLLYQAIRYTPKGFSQRRPDGKNWIYNLQGVRRVVYRLPDLKGCKAVIWCEGEKDAERSWSLGIPATCNPMGAGKWVIDYAHQLAAQGVQRVAVIPDNDPVGHAHAAVVTAGLLSVGIEVRSVTLPDSPDHGDLSDYLATGKTKEDLLALLKAAPLATVAKVVDEGPDKQFTPVGERRYRLTLRSAGVVMEVDRLRRDREGMTGELVVKVNGHFPQARSHRDGILSVGDFNFTSVQARSTRAKLLAERAGDKEFDWYGLLEEFVVEVITHERQGAPPVVLGSGDDQPEEDEVAETWDVHGLPVLIDDSMVLFGDSASGKSYLALWIAGTLALRGVKVLYVDWEFSEREHRKRLRRLFHPTPKNLHYIRSDVPIIKEVDRLSRLIADHGYQYMICDSIGFAVDGPAETHDAARGYFAALRYCGIGSLSLAHIAKVRDDGREATIFGCYSEDTDVLTRDGWKNHAAVTLADEVLSWDRTVEAYRWERPTAVHQYDYDGEMIRLSTSSTEALVTPNHRCVVRKPKYKTGSGKKVGHGPWGFTEAKDLPVYTEVPISADFDSARPELSVDGGDDWLRLIGWFVSEGSFHQKHSFSLAQANDSPLTQRMIDTLARLDIPVTRCVSKMASRPNEKEMCYLISRRSASDVTEWLRANCGSGAADKKLPAITWSLSKRQQQVLLEALIDGDGSRHAYGGMRYHSVSRRLIDDVQRLAIECGHTASARWLRPGKVWHYARGYVNISREARRVLGIYKRHATRVPYAGKVYCLTVPSGAYVTRRLGKMAIYGNSTFFRAGARSAWFVDRASENARGELNIGLQHRKSNLSDLLKPLAYTFKFTPHSVSVERGDVNKIEALTSQLPLIDRLKRHMKDGEFYAFKDLAEDLIVSVDTIRKATARSKHFQKLNRKIRVVRQDEAEEAASEPPPKVVYHEF